VDTLHWLIEFITKEKKTVLDDLISGLILLFLGTLLALFWKKLVVLLVRLRKYVAYQTKELYRIRIKGDITAEEFTKLHKRIKDNSKLKKFEQKAYNKQLQLLESRNKNLTKLHDLIPEEKRKEIVAELMKPRKLKITPNGNYLVYEEDEDKSEK
jgi:hypothetical protein